ILLTTFWGSYTLSSFSPLKFKVKIFPFVTSLVSGALNILLPAHRISISLFINGGKSISIKGIPTLSGIGFHFTFFPFTKIVFIDPFHADKINFTDNNFEKFCLIKYLSETLFLLKSNFIFGVSIEA